MRYSVIFMLLMIPSVIALAESSLNQDIVSNINVTDVIDERGAKFDAVVVGYDAAITDYRAGAELAVFLTARSTATAKVDLTCATKDSVTIFTPSDRQVLFLTDRNVVGQRRIIIGGAASNTLAADHPANSELRNAGDMTITLSDGDLLIAGYTGLDTERAVKKIIDALQE